MDILIFVSLILLIALGLSVFVPENGYKAIGEYLTSKERRRKLFFRICVSLIFPLWLGLLPKFLFLIYMFHYSFFSYEIFHEANDAVWVIWSVILGNGVICALGWLAMVSWVPVPTDHSGSKSRLLDYVFNRTPPHPRWCHWVSFILGALLLYYMQRLNLYGVMNVDFWCDGFWIFVRTSIVPIAIAVYVAWWAIFPIKSSIYLFWIPIVLALLMTGTALHYRENVAALLAAPLREFNLGGLSKIEIFEYRPRPEGQRMSAVLRMSGCLLLITSKNIVLANERAKHIATIIPITDDTYFKVSPGDGCKEAR